jgi:hypothetical protein
MMQVDHTANSNWNCGVLIYGSSFIVCSIIAGLLCILAALLLKAGWWSLPFRQIRAILLYRPHHQKK